MITIIPTGADPTQAPEGQDTVWSWTGIAPARPAVPWSEVAAAVAEREIARAARFLGGLGAMEIARQVMTPPDFAARFRVPDGNVYHVDPTAMRFGPLRPAVGFAGFTSPIDGLILSGAGVHPSAGICGVPGKLAAAAALKELGRTPSTRLQPASELGPAGDTELGVDLLQPVLDRPD
jgi:phytoene dehydrogenase-like protein